jgi:hypothetical protein
MPTPSSDAAWATWAPHGPRCLPRHARRWLTGQLASKATEINFSLAALGPRLAKYAVSAVAGFSIGFVYARMPFPKYRARWVSVSAKGTRFGWRRAVPWPDVVDVTLDGPLPGDPDQPGVMVWTLRNGSEVRVPLHASRRLPEELILAARSCMAAASAVRTA